MDPRETLRLVREDAVKDGQALDGLPFTGRTVGEAIGNLLAMVLALVTVVENLLLEDRT